MQVKIILAPVTNSVQNFVPFKVTNRYLGIIWLKRKNMSYCIIAFYTNPNKKIL